MSDESRYYKTGQERGKEDKATPLGIFNLADKAEERAAQRGWEAGQSAREHADALEEKLEAAREESDTSSSYDYSDSGTSSVSTTSSSPSSTTSPAWSLAKSVLIFILWTGGSWVLKGLCEQMLASVHEFSLVWWIIGLVWLLCWPGIIVGALVLLVLSLIAMIVMAIVSALVWLVRYFFQNPI